MPELEGVTMQTTVPAPDPLSVVVEGHAVSEVAPEVVTTAPAVAPLMVSVMVYVLPARYVTGGQDTE